MRILVTGGCILDLIARPHTVTRGDTSNEASILWAAGGAARNVAENLRRLGIDVTLVTSLGADPAGQFLLDSLAVSGLDVRLTPGGQTGIYLAILHPDGGLDRGLCQTGSEHVPLADWLAPMPALTEFDGAVLDGNIGEAALAGLASRLREAQLPYALDTVAVDRARRTLPALPGCALVKPDRAEARSLTGLPCETPEDGLACARRLREMGAVRALVSLGPQGFSFAGPEGERIVAALETTVVDVTGAGDALLATAFAGIVQGLPVDHVLQAARHAATLTCASIDIVSDAISPELLITA